MLKKTLAAGVLTLGFVSGSLVVAAVNPFGLAGAQDDAETIEEPPPIDAPRPQRGHVLQDALDSLVADGTLTQAQADAVLARLQELRPELPDRDEHPFRPRPGHFGGTQFDLEELAEVLGLEADAIRTALADGQTIAEVATANGIDPQTVIDALVAEAEDRIDEAVANGRMEAERAEELKSHLVEEITNFVNSTRPERTQRPFDSFDRPRSDRPDGPPSDQPIGPPSEFPQDHPPAELPAPPADVPQDPPADADPPASPPPPSEEQPVLPPDGGTGTRFS